MDVTLSSILWKVFTEVLWESWGPELIHSEGIFKFRATPSHSLHLSSAFAFSVASKKMMVVLLVTEDLSLLEDLPYTSDGVSWAAGTCLFCDTVMSTPTDLAIRGEATDNVVKCREGRRSQ